MASKAKASVPAVQQQGSSVAVPDFMKGGKTAKIGNLDTSDLIIPRLKLLQKISPELEAHNDAKPRTFFHTIAEQSIGDLLRGVPIFIRKEIVLWAPRGDDRRILARSSDCVHWDTDDMKGQDFEVKPKAGAKQTWSTMGSVAESGLDKFGTSIKGDPNSPPAASLTYTMIWYLLDYPDMSPVTVINTRSAIKAAKALNAKINMRDGNHYGQVFNIGITDEGTTDEPYYGYSYTANGYVDNGDLYHRLEDMFRSFDEAQVNWRTNDDDEEPENEGGSAPKGNAGGRGNKF